MHKVTFFPLGNADTSFIELDNGRKILFDYANKRDPENDDDSRCDLKKEILEILGDADTIDVVAFSHLDEDHYKGASEFFWLEYEKKYQDDGRIKIDCLWVPATVITETGLDKEEAQIIQKEARHRFKNGKNIRVFSRPEKLKKWCEDNGIKLDDRRNLITDAGKIPPEFKIDEDGVEFFCHSPFAKRLNDSEVEDRNDDSLVMQAVFEVSGVKTKALFMADVSHEIITDIVEITRDKKKQPERLEWDFIKLPHHCSYNSLADECGKNKTAPLKEVKWLYETQGQNKCRLISTSKPIPKKGTDEDKDKQPPHRQAASYYKGIAKEKDGEFLVTMEEPNKKKPRPITIEITSKKAKIKKTSLAGPAVITSMSTPRAG